jgi:CRISPR-associated endoribonuclease Cas6
LRLTFRIHLHEKSAIPIAYRKMVLSIIKELFKQADPSQYHTYFENNTLKPYSFSIFLPQPTFNKTEFILAKPYLDITFSTAEWSDIACLHNGLLALSHPQRPQLRYKTWAVSLSNPILKPEPKITETCIHLKTLSPIVLRNPNAPQNWCLRLEKEGLEAFTHQLNVSMTPLTQHFLGKDPHIGFRPIPGKFKETIMRVEDDRDSQSTGLMFAHKGEFQLTGDPDVLNLSYQTGLGAKRGYGLGCVEGVGE